VFGIRIHRPSPALAVAVLALLIALSGTAYAAATLPRHSVGTAQLKNRAVTLTKIAPSAQRALTPRAWATVKGNGTFIAGRGFSPTIVHGCSGCFNLLLSKRATNCAAIASVNPLFDSSVTDPSVNVDISNGTRHMEVIPEVSGSAADEGFSVVVYC
jgi:hypothetical protein